MSDYCWICRRYTHHRSPDCPILASHIREANEKYREEKNMTTHKLNITEAEFNRDITYHYVEVEADWREATLDALKKHGVHIEFEPEKVEPVRGAKLTKHTELRNKMTVVGDFGDTFCHVGGGAWRRPGYDNYPYSTAEVLGTNQTITFEGVK